MFRENRVHYEEGWERRRTHLDRHQFQEGPQLLSAVREEQSSDFSQTFTPLESATEESDRYTPLPPLIIEREVKKNKHDDPDEYYIKLEIKMKRIYRRMFIEDRSDIDDITDRTSSDVSITRTKYIEKRASFSHPMSDVDSNKTDDNIDDAINEVLIQKDNSESARESNIADEADEKRASFSDVSVVSNVYDKNPESDDGKVCSDDSMETNDTQKDNSESDIEESDHESNIIDEDRERTSANDRSQIGDVDDKSADGKDLDKDDTQKDDSESDTVESAREGSILEEDKDKRSSLSDRSHVSDDDGNSAEASDGNDCDMVEKIVTQSDDPEPNTLANNNDNYHHNDHEDIKKNSGLAEMENNAVLDTANSNESTENDVLPHIEVMRSARLRMSADSMQNEPQHDSLCNVTAARESRQALLESESSKESLPIGMDCAEPIDFDTNKPLSPLLCRPNTNQNLPPQGLRKRSSSPCLSQSKRARKTDGTAGVTDFGVQTNFEEDKRRLLCERMFVGIPHIFKLCSNDQHHLASGLESFR